jgi:maltooligosyltrehalose trehalohydrolase
MRRAHAMPFGAELTPEGVRFALWAPTAAEVALVLDGAERLMPDVGSGWRRQVIPEAKAGSRYGWRIDGSLVVPDPASRAQPDDVHGLSLVVDPGAYTWSDGAWTGRPWEEAVIYEAHVGTATPEGTFAGLMGKLEALRDLGVTALQLLPVNDFQGSRNWGYDGVLPYAPDGAYGSPDDLKRLVDRAHALGVMVFLDVVYNHFGPSGNYLHAYAKTFFTERHPTPWGAGVNVDGPEGVAVRDFFCHNAMYWLEEFNIDGLRFDAVHAIQDDGPKHLIQELAERARAALPGREIHLVLENEANQARWLGREDGRPTLHTAQWNDDVHHGWHVALTGESEAYYQDFADRPLEHLARSLAEGFAYQGEEFGHTGRPRGELSGHLPPTAFVAFLQNHDQVGNRAMGERLDHLAPRERMPLARAGLILAPSIPMLFMGEEWAASTPFQFFVDFAPDDDLSRAVREGRRREFSRFKAFSEPGASERIPDPTDEATFLRSKLDWSEIEREPHRGVREEVRRLLDIRRREVVPLLALPFRGASRSLSRDGLIDVTWRFADEILRFVGNFGSGEAEVDLGGARPIWLGPGGGEEGGRARLPAWSGAFTRGRA